MLRHIVLLASCVAIGMVGSVPIGYGPGLPIASAIPVAPPMYPLAKPIVYDGYTNNVGGYNGGNNMYKDYATNGVGRESIRDSIHMANQGMEGVADEHFIAKSDEDVQDYQHKSAGADYNHGGYGYYGGANNYGVASKEGYGGAGNVGHKKGHKTTGFQKSYHNVESGKDSTFLDENHDESEEKFGQHYDDQYNDKRWGAQSTGLNNGKYGHAAVHDTAARGDAKSAGIQRVNYDRLGHNGYYNNKDLAYNNDHLEAVRNNHHAAGSSGIMGRHNGAYYDDYMF